MYLQIPFKEHAMGEGRLMDQPKSKKTATTMTTTTTSAVHDTYCFPFQSLMMALNVTHVDYLSLDVEGLELEILRTIPFDLIHISVLSVEFSHAPNGAGEYVKFMESKGYKKHSRISMFHSATYFGANDFIFVKK